MISRSSFIVLFWLLLIAEIFAQKIPVTSEYFQSIDFSINKKEFVINNDGDKEHEYLIIKMPGQVSAKYQRVIVPGMFLIIQKDDDSIDLINVIKKYMSYLSNNLQAVGKTYKELPPLIKGFQDQIHTEYQYNSDNMDFEGDLFVGRRDGFLFIAWSTSTTDLYQKTSQYFNEILGSISFKTHKK